LIIFRHFVERDCEERQLCVGLYNLLTFFSLFGTSEHFDSFSCEASSVGHVGNQKFAGGIFKLLLQKNVTYLFRKCRDVHPFFLQFSIEN